MKIALAQVKGSPLLHENSEAARKFALEAAHNGAELLVFPEMFMALPQKTSSLSTIAEPIDGVFVSSLKTLAQAHGLYIISGIWEKILEEERVHNTAIMVSPTGDTLTVYRKLHLFDALSIQESQTMRAGDQLPSVVAIDRVMLGLAICYDLRFPELFRVLALQGVNLFIVPSAWYAGPLKEDQWLTLLRARAIENTCYVAGVNQTGSAFCGRSAVFDPFGVLIAEAGEEPGLLFAEVDANRFVAVRTKLPTLQHVRSDIFRFSA